MKTSLFSLLLTFSALSSQARELNLSLSRSSANDIRTLAPVQPELSSSAIALPQSGDDLTSVSSDWARRQFHLSSNGADDRFVDATNETLDRCFRQENQRSPASPSGDSQRAELPTQWKPRSLRMTKPGAFELGFTGDTTLSYDLVNGSELTLSKPLFQDIDIRLHHESSMDTLQLKLDW